VGWGLVNWYTVYWATVITEPRGTRNKLLTDVVRDLEWKKIGENQQRIGRGKATSLNMIPVRRKKIGPN
jgi:hypothetical protein